MYKSEIIYLKRHQKQLFIGYLKLNIGPIGCIGDEFHFLFKCTVLNDLRNALFNDALNTFYLRLYGVG